MKRREYIVDMKYAHASNSRHRYDDANLLTLRWLKKTNILQTTLSQEEIIIMYTKTQSNLS